MTQNLAHSQFQPFPLLLNREYLTRETPNIKTPNTKTPNLPQQNLLQLQKVTAA